jgi:hypothetical protein
MKLKIFVFFLAILICGSLFAQNHVSVHLEDQIYHILEQAETRGLCAPLSGSRPYTQSVIIAAINDILSSEYSQKLKKTEREILNEYLEKFSKPKTGLDWRRGAWYGETAANKSAPLVSGNIGVTADIQGSSGIYSSEERYFGTEIWLGVYVNGDLGRNVSFEFIYQGGLISAPRKSLGTYNTYYKGFPKEDATNSEYANREIDIFSEPLTHFPYAYKKQWDSSVFFFSNITGYDSWPESIAGSYSLPAELAASFFENKLILRLGRISHDWGSTSFGSSLAFNQMARPFLGIEGEFFPVPWFGISSLSGILEYYNTEGIYNSPRTNQNAFSITMLQFRYKNYLFFDFVDAAIWPKRLEFGYISPITNNFFYQSNAGKFDNMAITLNLKVQYPGLGNIWLSLFVDEMNLISDLLTLDRQMLTMQGGLNLPLPFLPFSSLKMSYTKVNPYCYTHHRNYLPWYGDFRMEKSYSNNGVCLGYYLPPNSDELLVRYQAIPAKSINAHLQYQLIRHGADFGPNAVDGSNLLSELDPNGRDTNPVLKRFFLKDGAYQWMNIIKAGLEWNVPRLPVSLYGELGVNYSFFTDIDEDANVNGKAYPNSVVDTPSYPKSTSFIMQIGFKLYPR